MTSIVRPTGERSQRPTTNRSPDSNPHEEIVPTNWVLSAEFDPGDLDTGREHGTARAEMTFMPLIPVDPTDRALATELLARYAEAVDAGDFDAVGALLADATIEDAVGNEITSGAVGVAALFAATTRRHEDGTPLTGHVITNVIVEAVGSDELELRSRFTVFQAAPGLPLQPIVIGRYVDRVVRGADGWRFARRRMIPERWGDVSRHLTFDPTA
ncbi:MAG TPA: nuclear transport factor 2 family protein [Microthrixaceae bacterium]|nr:nuclear transport factor 2 family protein [Microthrixaceae bacterium]